MKPQLPGFLNDLETFPQRLVRLADHHESFRVHLVDDRLQLLDLGAVTTQYSTGRAVPVYAPVPIQDGHAALHFLPGCAPQPPPPDR